MRMKMLLDLLNSVDTTFRYMYTLYMDLVSRGAGLEPGSKTPPGRHIAETQGGNLYVVEIDRKGERTLEIDGNFVVRYEPCEAISYIVDKKGRLHLRVEVAQPAVRSVYVYRFPPLTASDILFLLLNRDVALKAIKIAMSNGAVKADEHTISLIKSYNPKAAPEPQPLYTPSEEDPNIYLSIGLKDPDIQSVRILSAFMPRGSPSPEEDESGFEEIYWEVYLFEINGSFYSGNSIADMARYMALESIPSAEISKISTHVNKILSAVLYMLSTKTAVQIP